MSRYVKGLVIDDIRRRLEGVEDAVVVNVVGMTANNAVKLRKELREKQLGLLVVRSNLARLATKGTGLEGAFSAGTESKNPYSGSTAIIWGGSDFVSLAKEVTRLADGKDYKEFETKGGVMDGENLSSDRVKEISKWPSREEQLSLLVGQILGPGRNLAAALIGPGAALASQVKKKSEEEAA